MGSVKSERFERTESHDGCSGCAALRAKVRKLEAEQAHTRGLLREWLEGFAHERDHDACNETREDIAKGNSSD